MARKAVKKKKEFNKKELELKSTDEWEGNLIEETARILSTQPEHITKTLSRFLKELEEFKRQL